MHESDFVRRIQSLGDRSDEKNVLELDYFLIAILLSLCSVGILIIYSATGQDTFFVKRQLLFIAFGFTLMCIMANLSPRVWDRWALFLYAIGIVSLGMVLAFGVEANGAKRWLNLGFTRLQPSELMKVAVPLMISSYISKSSVPPTFKTILVSIMLILLPVLLVINQPDLGTALLIFISGLIVLFLSGIGRSYIISGFILALAAIPSLWLFVMRDYQKQRVLTMFNPEQDKLGAGWNIIQSTTAIGSGGWYGKGWMNGTQSQLNFLPESHTDFIIAVLAEEFGLVGVMVLNCLYLILVGRCISISMNSESMFGRLLAASIGLTLFVFVLVNLAMVSGVLPVVGAPLPFISYGGTAIVTLFGGFGILMCISNESKTNRSSN
ncbi:MAG: rod shape-determining protein RodA [Porticoccaceae bacterium]|nr:rod shape-determining protein RodA [Porticoccaceae bacterium]